MALAMASCCSHCGKAGAAFLCSRCRAAHFCDTVCQRAGWKVHRQGCALSESPSVATSELTPSELARLPLVDLLSLILAPESTVGTAASVCQLLKRLVTHAASDAGRARGIDALVAVMMRHAARVDIMVDACDVLDSIAASSTAYAATCAAAIPLRAIVEVLTRHISHGAVCLSLCSVLNLASESGLHEKASTAAAALPIVIRTVDVYSPGTDREALRAALYALSSFIIGHPTNRAAAAKEGATPVLLRLLARRWLRIEGRITPLVCNVLRGLTCDFSLRQAALVLDSRALEHLLHIVRTHAASETVSLAAGVIVNVIGGDRRAPMMLVVESAMGGEDETIMPTLVNAMIRHATHAEATKILSHLIHRIASALEDTKDAFVDSGVLHVLKSALTLHKANPGVFGVVCDTLRCFMCPCHGRHYDVDFRVAGITVKAFRAMQAESPDVAESMEELIQMLENVRREDA